MSKAAREYTALRLPQVEAIAGTAERTRLYRNLLSSQPLAFSIAAELRQHPGAAAAVLKNLTKEPVKSLAVLTGDGDLAAYTLGGIEAEWFPPRVAHTGDRSGFDIAACVDLDTAQAARMLVSIEVKYTDSFSAKPVTWDRYANHLTELGIDTPAALDALVRQGLQPGPAPGDDHRLRPSKRPDPRG
jgi:hypothetical protein